MRVFEEIADFKKNPKQPLILALGNFDGMHRGHQRLLRYVTSQARRLGGKPAVFTFQRHPQRILHPAYKPENLQSREQKLEFFKKLGIQVCFLQKFDRRFAAFSAEDFVKKILVQKLGIREICLGFNARFGRGRSGDADLLRRIGPSCGFRVFQAKPVLWRGKPASSTAVRQAVHYGKMEEAAGLLGRFWSLEGRVMRGDRRGHKLGFPTANLDLGESAQPALGVYAVKVRVPGRKTFCEGVANVGVRPSFGKDLRLCVEAHLLRFNQNLYGKKIEVFFVKYLRAEKKFNSPEFLKKQICADIQNVRAVFKKKRADAA